MACPKEAIEYYNLPKDAKMRDLILAVRADESCHREVNHHFADCNFWEPIDHSKVSLGKQDQLNFEREEETPQIESSTSNEPNS